MKPFRFTLTALRTWRERLECLALEQFAASVRAECQAQDRLRQAQQEQAAAWAQRQDQMAAGAPAVRILQIQDYCQHLEIERRKCDQALQAARRVVQQKLQNLLSARQQRRVVDRFFDRQRARYNQQCQREEQKLLDELANLRAAAASSSVAVTDVSGN